MVKVEHAPEHERFTSQLPAEQTILTRVHAEKQTRIAVVLVNFRGASDTLDCLESLLRTEGVDVRAIVIENGSGNDSAALFRACAEGAVDEETLPEKTDLPPPELWEPWKRESLGRPDKPFTE